MTESSINAKKRRMESLSDCMASDVQDIRDKDELEVYGSDKRTSTELTTYMFEVKIQQSLIFFFHYKLSNKFYMIYRYVTVF